MLLQFHHGDSRLPLAVAAQAEGLHLFVFAQNVLVTVLTIPSRASMQTILRKKNVSGFAEA